MRSAKTVFVVGAGASHEVGLPVGSELASLIADRLDYDIGKGLPGTGDRDILDVLQQDFRTREAIVGFVEAAQRVRKGIIFSRSIDSFLDVHRSDQLVQRCGKLAIAKTILEREGQSCLYSNGGEFRDLDAVKKSWLINLAQGLFDGVRKEDIGRLFERVSFVVFNYDRCIEHFLFEAVKRHYSLENDQTAEVMATLKILHPYGKIADLPWQSAEDDCVPFGFSANRANLQLMEGRIKTYTERVAERDLLHSIRRQIIEADTLVFLGSSFHPENMKIIAPSTKTNVRRIFGTAYGVSDSDLSDIEEKVRDLLEEQPSWDREVSDPSTFLHSDLKCSGILPYYSRSLFMAGHRDA